METQKVVEKHGYYVCTICGAPNADEDEAEECFDNCKWHRDG